MKKLTILFLALLIPVLAFAFTYDWTIDNMEYSSDAAAQAAYVSSDEANVDTKLLLHLNGADEAVVTTDDSDSNHTINFNGTAQLDTAEKKWGASSLLLDGNSDYLNVDDSADWDLCGSSTDDWTIDFQVKFASYTGYHVIMAQKENSTNRWIVDHNATGGFSLAVKDADANVINIPLGGLIEDNDWHHVALCKVGSLWAFYVDGTQVNYLDDSSTVTFAGSLYIGYNGYSGNYYFNGNLDEVRIIHSNIFNASPNDTPNDTIIVPTSEHAPLRAYSESTIKTQGTYSLKGVAAITDSLNDTLTRTIADNLDLSNSEAIEYDIYALRTGSNIKIGIHDSGGTTTEHTANVASSNTNQTESWDISGVSDANKDDIDSIIVTISNADAANTFYLDDIKWGIDAVAGGGNWTWVQ